MRQLLVSDGTAPAYTNGVLANGAIDIQIESPAGPVSLSAGQTISDSDKIRFVQGTGLKNIFSPWIEGKNVAVWKGESYSAQVPHVFTVTLATNITAAGEATFKLVELNNGQAQFVRKSVTIPVSAGQTPTQVAQDIVDAMAGVSNSVATTVYQIVGFPQATIEYNAGVIEINGDIFSLSAGTELANIKFASEGLDGSNGMTATLATTSSPSLGYGDAEVLAQYEKSLQGNTSFYNRIMQPNTPPSYIDIATPTTYDVYSLVADNGSVGQIKGVDNVRSITIAYKVNGTDQANFEAKMNGYLASCPGAFAPVNL